WIRAWERKRSLRYIGFDGTGHQVRDCLHARDLAPLLSRQMQKPASDAPRIINVGGGIEGSASLRQLSAWCEKRFGPVQISPHRENRPFDIPWLVLDSALAQRVWDWKPQPSLEAIWSEIATHAEKHPDWLELADDSTGPLS